MCVQVEAKGWGWMSYLITLHLNFLRQGLPLNLSLTSLTSLVGTQTSTCLWLLSTWITGTCCFARLLCGWWGSKVRCMILKWVLYWLSQIPSHLVEFSEMSFHSHPGWTEAYNLSLSNTKTIGMCCYTQSEFLKKHVFCAHLVLLEQGMNIEADRFIELSQWNAQISGRVTWGYNKLLLPVPRHKIVILLLLLPEPMCKMYGVYAARNFH